LEIELFNSYHNRDGLKIVSRQANEELRFAFVGGSVTNGSGASPSATKSWRALTGSWLSATLSNNKVRVINAGVGGTNSTYGAFRMVDQVFRFGVPDLVFVEFAVNDEENRNETIRALEGLVRHTRAVNPKAALCFIYMANRKNVDAYSHGDVPANIENQEVVADYYHLPSIDICRYVADQSRLPGFRWEDFYIDHVHPNNCGHALYSNLMQLALFNMITITSSNESLLNPSPYVAGNYERGHLLNPDQMATVNIGWQVDPDLAVTNIMNCSPPVRVFQASTAGQTFLANFFGDAIGAVLLVGPDCGFIDYKIDAGEWTTYNPYDKYAVQFHRIKTVMFQDALPLGDHVIQIRVSSKRNPQSDGQAIRILQLMVNG